jgi:hypothetical protein
MRTAILFAAALPLAALAWPDPAGAASCREQLEDFERRLHESALAAEDPDQYAALSRQAEEISELRDEELCVERLAELGEEIPEPAAPTTTGMNVPGPGEAAGPAPPAAPFLIETAPADQAAEPGPAEAAPAADPIPDEDVAEGENRS